MVRWGSICGILLVSLGFQGHYMHMGEGAFALTLRIGVRRFRGFTRIFVTKPILIRENLRSPRTILVMLTRMGEGAFEGANEE